MLSNLKELYSLLTEEQRRRILRLQVLVVIMAFAEIAGVVSIGPFMALVGNMEQLHGNGLVGQIYRTIGLTDQGFMFSVGIAVLSVLVVSGLFSMFTVWRLSLFGASVGAQISSRLYSHYMHQPWLFHAGGSSSTLTKQISQETQRVTTSIIGPLMQMNAKLALIICMSVVLFVYNPWVAVGGVVIFVSAYFLLYKTVRQKLVQNGRAISNAQTSRFKLMAEGFGGIKDVLLLDRQSIYTDRFSAASDQFAYALGTTQALSQAPRYAMEIIAYGAVIFLVLTLLAAYGGDAAAIMPVLSVYALAGFKLLPAFQVVYTSVSSIRGNLAAFEAIRDDLRQSRAVAQGTEISPSSANAMLKLERSIEIENVTFRYPGKLKPALYELSLEIPSRHVVGLVGATGSGKSTVIDILLGLISPASGSVRIDGVELRSENRRQWQDSLGFVPQSIFLADSSIAENIAFGLRPESVDMEKVKDAVHLAHLDELLVQLPDGLNTRVGERGVQLSGGQRQRIGIARALYHDADVLILDEATSALDGITEKLIMDAIHDFSGKKTIIMIAHRLATVKKCDRIFLMANGEVIDHGNYEDLVGRSDVFKRMALHA